MKTRISRKNVEIDYKRGKMGLNDVFDNAVLSLLRVTQDEYDTILEQASDDELEYIVTEAVTFSDKKVLINSVNFLYKYFASIKFIPTFVS